VDVFVIVVICAGVCIDTIVQDVLFKNYYVLFGGRLGFESGGMDAEESVLAANW